MLISQFWVKSGQFWSANAPESEILKNTKFILISIHLQQNRIAIAIPISTLLSDSGVQIKIN